MKKMILALAILLISLPVYADGWESQINITAGSASSRLVFGQQPDATDGIDGQYDIPAMLNGSLQVVFDSGKQLWRDIRISDSVSSWTIDILAAEERVNLSWDTTALPAMVLVDLKTGDVTNMQEVDNLEISGPRRLEMKMEE
ncbi:MAG: hypothetical protein K0A93_11920 [Desulfuromonadaceae bacterium]|nr:hypothetical protein [Desulfuromonadaceae bacterium]